MIAFEAKNTRRLVGCLQERGDVVDALREVCRAQRVTSGRIIATGFVRTCRFLTYDATKRDLIAEPEFHEGPFALLGLGGSISQGSTGTELSLFGQVAHASNSSDVRGGALAGAEVMYVEYEIQSVDSIDFVREKDAHSGLLTWVNIRAPLPASTPAVAQTSPLPTISPPTSLPQARTSEHLENDAPEEWEELALDAGDVLHHPKLGACTVVDEPDDDRVSVQLANGRVVELYLGLVELTLRQPPSGATREYSVRIRRR